LSGKDDIVVKLSFSSVSGTDDDDVDDDDDGNAAMPLHRV
jgi:hypothetical protein